MSGEISKQYHLSIYTGFRYLVKLYENGKKIKVEKVYDNEINNYCKNLEDQGYTRGFLHEEVETARKAYQYRLKNEIAAAR